MADKPVVVTAAVEDERAEEPAAESQPSETEETVRRGT